MVACWVLVAAAAVAALGCGSPAQAYECEARSMVQALDYVVADGGCIELELEGIDWVAAGAGPDSTRDRFVAGLKTARHITQLEVSGSPLPANILDAMLRAAGSRLTVLEVTRAQLGDEGAALLAAYLPTMKLLRKLDLSKNTIGDTGAADLAKALTGLALHSLDLEGNPIGDKGGLALAWAIPKSFLRQLDLEQTGIGDNTALALVQAIGAENAVLHHLDVSKCAGITAVGLKALQHVYDNGYPKVALKFDGRQQSFQRVGEERLGVHVSNVHSGVNVRAPAFRWSESQVSDWVGSLHPSFASYGELFSQHAVNGATLAELKEEDLADLVPNRLHRKRLIAEIRRLFARDEL